MTNPENNTTDNEDELYALVRAEPPIACQVTREQFMLGQAIAGIILATNPPFCGELHYADEDTEVSLSPEYKRNVALVVAGAVGYSHMMVEDLQDVLDEVIKVIQEKCPITKTPRSPETENSPPPQTSR